MKIVNDIDNNKVSFYINIIIYTSNEIEKPFCGEKKIIISRRKPRQNDGRKGQNGGEKIRDDVIFFLESSSFLSFLSHFVCGSEKKSKIIIQLF